MSTLLLTFANNERERSLKTLKDEYDGVSDALREREARKDFVVKSDPIADREKIVKDIRANQGDICLFLFSGHAGRDKLIFADGASPSDGIADLLGHCPQLVLVILNGCSTAGQVKALLDKKIPIVIATSSPVDDRKATVFSKALFRELSLDRSINEAFDLALEESNLEGSYQTNQKVPSRGLVLEKGEVEDKPLWGLYYTESAGEELMDNWRLPKNTSVPNQNSVNDELKDALMGISQEYKVDPSREKMLALLPFLVSEPIRKLLTPKEGVGVFYDTPSKDRFRMLLFAYRAIINLATYTLLAQLWDEGLNKGNNSLVSGECQKLFKSNFIRNQESINIQSNLELLKLLLKVMEEENLSCFMIEMNDLLEKLNEADTKNALDDLESKLAKENEYSTAPDLLRLCLDTETSVARILYDFRFMINYSLTSIPNIEFIKSQRLKSQFYRHRFLMLRNYADALKKEDEQLVSESPLDNSSVIIQKHGDRSTEANLNLSPFLVDKNALENSSKPDLHFLLYFFPQKNTFYYSPATSYKNTWKVSPEENKAPTKNKYSQTKPEEVKPEWDAPLTFNSLINKQIESFASVVLNKTLQEL